MSDRCPITGKMKKGHKQGFQPGNTLGKKFSKDHQPKGDMSEHGKKISAGKRKAYKSSKKRAERIVGKTLIPCETKAQETLLESGYNPLLKSIRLAKYFENCVRLNYCRLDKKVKDEMGQPMFIEEKPLMNYKWLRSYVGHLISLLPYYSQKAAKKQLVSRVKREVKEIPEISQEDIEKAAAEFDDMFG
tara:strand:+ start:17093 stop:17659 length:567 start_codon:yes stop_codon:yes gene_type:complete